MNTLRLYAAVSCFFLFLSCVENEIETFDISIDIQPHGSATIEPKVSNIANKANINPSLLRQYKTGKAKASEEKAKKVLKATHELGKELLSVSF